jgi:phage terminase small subunit
MNPPKPTALKVLQGTDQPSRRNPAEPKPARGAEKPAHLSVAASELWDEYAPMLTRLGLLRETDALAFEDLCETTVRWRMLRHKRDFRAAVASDRAREHMLKLLGHFGMTPSSATRVTATPAAEVDPLEAWAAKG